MFYVASVVTLFNYKGTPQHAMRSKLSLLMGMSDEVERERECRAADRKPG